MFRTRVMAHEEHDDDYCYLHQDGWDDHPHTAQGVGKDVKEHTLQNRDV